MGKNRISQSVEIPDHPEFWFLRDYPPLTPEQQIELAAVIKLLHEWENLSVHRVRYGMTVIGNEGAAFIAFQRAIDSFKSKHGFTDLPSDPVAAVRANVRSRSLPVITLLEHVPDRADFQDVIDKAWQTWWDRLDGVTNPPPERPIVSNYQEALAALALLLRALNQIASRQPAAITVDAIVEEVDKSKQPKKVAKKRRNRKPRTVELLLVFLEDRTNTNLNYSELAEKLEVHVSSISRAFKNPKYGPEILRRYRDHGVPPPRSHQI